MSICITKKCPNLRRPTPSALFCQDCQDGALGKIERRWHRAPRCITPAEVAAEHKRDLAGLGGDKVKFLAPLGPLPPAPTTGIFTGTPNVTCPVCEQRYHYGAPVPFTHLCPLCDTWLCWKETGETKAETRRVAKKCPTCGKLLQEKSGKYGPWWGCTWVRKGHKDNCAGRRSWSDCDTESFEVPRLGLAVWKAPVWDDSDDAARFSRAWEKRQDEDDVIRAREERYKPKWWERKAGEGLDGIA